MKSYGLALIQNEQCPNKKRRSGHRHAQREDHVRTQEKDGHLKAKERASSEGANPAHTSIWDSRLRR